MIKFRVKLFNDAFEEYQSPSKKRLNNIIQNSLKDVEKYKEDTKDISSSILNPTSKGGFKEYKTKRIKARNNSLKNLISEESKTGKISNGSLLKHGLRYGKKSK